MSRFPAILLSWGQRQERSSATGVNGDQADNSKQNAGAVYVFTRTGGVWTQQAYLKASNTDAWDGFGTSVALEGDTLVVGAPFESSNATGVNGNEADNSAPHSGAAYVFTRTGGVWTQQAYLKASNTDAEDNFGIAVTLAGETLAVGALQESSNATGVNGNQADNTCAKRWSSLCVHAYRWGLDSAGLSQSLKHREPVRVHSCPRRRHASCGSSV